MFKIDGKFFLLATIFVIIGPLMSWLFLGPNKGQGAIFLDSCFIVLLQVVFFVSLLYVTVVARPLALVFEVDRFKVITYSDIPESSLLFAPEWFSPWKLGSKELPVIGLRELRNIDEKMASVEKAFLGVDAGQDPQRWIAFDESVKENILSRALPISVLLQGYPEVAPLYEETIGNGFDHIANAKWLPIVSRHTYEWIAILDPDSARVLGVIPFDGFVY